MLKIFIKIRNYFLIKKYPFIECRNVWNNSKIDHKYEYTWLDDLPKGWRKRFGEDICKDLKSLFTQIDSIDFSDKYKITQIKEKYGQLRWYDTGVPTVISEQYDEVMQKYEELSEHTCTVCGKSGYIDYNDYWLEPLCDKHRNKSIKFR